jgi:hypothetical protein
MSGEDVKYVGKDIRFIKQKPGKLKTIFRYYYHKPVFLQHLLISLLAFLLFFLSDASMSGEMLISLPSEIVKPAGLLSGGT